MIDGIVSIRSPRLFLVLSGKENDPRGPRGERLQRARHSELDVFCRNGKLEMRDGVWEMAHRHL